MKYIFKDSCIGVSIFRQAGAAPAITLVSVVDITDSTANVNVSIADGEDVSKMGVEIDTDPLFSNPTAYEENGAVNTIAVDNLDAETTYYVRAYVIWSGQTIYSANSLNFTTASGSILPEELQACEYLESDGYAYINTVLKSTDITTLKCKCFCIGEVNIFGARTTSPYHSFQLGTNASGKYIFIYDNGAGSSQITTSNQSNADILEFEIKDNGKIYFNGVEYSNKKGTYTTNYNIFLFGINSVGNAVVNIYDKIYYWKTNICDLIPCYVKSGETFIDNKGNNCPAGTCGMYDIVNQVFYTNDGTGTFSKGADINI